MADKPAFDPNQPFQPAEKPVFDPIQPFEPGKPQSGLASAVSEKAPIQLVHGTLPKAISDIPRESYQTTMDTLGSLYKHLYEAPMERAKSSITAPSQGVAGDLAKGIGRTASDVGDISKGIGSAVGLPMAPVQGAARSLVGHPLSDVVTAMAPEGHDMNYDQAKGAVDLATSGIAPRRIRANGAVVAPALRREPPTVEEIRDASRQAYSEMRNLNVEIRPQPVGQLARRIESDLTDLGLTRRNVPETYDIIETLQNYAPRGAVLRGADLENIRQELTQARQSTNRREAVAANTAINHLENYLATIPQNHVISGDVGRLRELGTSARADWATASRADAAQGKIGLGELNANTANSGQNIDNSTRQAIKQLIRPDNRGRTPAQKMGFNADEIAQMNRVARGTFTGNAARFISHLFGGGGGLGSYLTAAGGALAAGPLGVALPSVGFGAKALSNASTLRQARILDEMVRARSALHQNAPMPPQPQLPAPSPFAGIIPAGVYGGSPYDRQRILQTAQNQED